MEHTVQTTGATSAITVRLNDAMYVTMHATAPSLNQVPRFLTSLTNFHLHPPRRGTRAQPLNQTANNVKMYAWLSLLDPRLRPRDLEREVPSPKGFLLSGYRKRFNRGGTECPIQILK